MRIIYKNFIKSWELFFNNKKYILLGILSDFLFFIAILTSWFFVSNKLIQNYDILQGMANSINPGGVTNESSLNLLSGQLDAINSVIKSIYLNLFLLVLLVFVSFVLFESFSWLIVKIVVNKEKLNFRLDYFLRFVGLSSVWFLLLLLVFFIMLMGISEDANIIAGLKVFAIACFSIICYFAIISYSYLLRENKIWKAMKNAFAKGIKKIYVLLPVLIIILLILFIISSLFGITYQIPFMFFAFTIIFLLIYIWARVYLLLVVREI